MLDVVLDALLDTALLALPLFLANVLIELLEHAAIGRIKTEKALKGGFAPLIGAGVGLLPQCGFSVVAAKLYSSRHITLGALLAVFVATSDEAIPILLSSPQSALKLLPLLGIKFVAALIIGYGASAVLLRREKRRIVEFGEGESFHATGCHGHEITDEKEAEETGKSGEPYRSPEDEKEAKKKKRKKLLERYLWHPLLHTFTVLLYVLAVNFLLGTLIYFIGEEKFAQFMNSSRLLQPLLASLVGLIPNCASSVAITELYAVGTLSLGGAVAGLSVNAGLGLAVLFKENKNVKENLAVLATLFVFGVATGTAIEGVLLAVGL